MITTIAKKRSIRRERPISAALRERADRILEAPYVFIDSTEFSRRTFEMQSGDSELDPLMPKMGWYHPTTQDLDLSPNRDRPAYMTRSEEREAFLRFNFTKLRLERLQRTVKRRGLTRETAEECVEWHRRLIHYREYLVRTNLSLVLAMARRTPLDNTDFAEVVSEGNMALLRAVDKFDADRGFKFSTYACRAILKAFYRMTMLRRKRQTRFPISFEPEKEKSDWIDKRRDIQEEDCVDDLRVVVDRNLAGLSDIEQTVIRGRFNWDEREEEILTLDELGEIIGLSKERIRQIQKKALGKIRQLIRNRELRVPISTNMDKPSRPISRRKGIAVQAAEGVSNEAGVSNAL